MSALDAVFFATCWLATLAAGVCDAAAGEGWPSVAGLLIGLTAGAIVFG